MKTLKNLLLTGLLIAFITGCANDSKTLDSSNQKKGTVSIDTTDTYTAEKYNVQLPRPYDLVATFNEAGLDFDATRINEPGNISKYKTNEKMLLNFGVYSSDLIYTIINNQPQLSMKNFNAIKKLAHKIGMGSIFENEDLLQKVEKNIADKDKMEGILFDIHDRAQKYLKVNQTRVFAAVQFTGAWIEGMYLGTFNLDQKDAEKFPIKIADQMNLFERGFKGYKIFQEGETSKIFKEIKALKKMYANFDTVKNAKGIPKLTMENVQKIASKIHNIRALIVQ